MIKYSRIQHLMSCFILVLFTTTSLSLAQESTSLDPKDDLNPIKVDWIGPFLDYTSLCYVNRKFTESLSTYPRLSINRVQYNVGLAPNCEEFSKVACSQASIQPSITVRHAWPPNWQRASCGKLVVIQPWEFGALPKEWVAQAPYVDEFWVPSNYVRDLYITSGVSPQKVIVVPNGVDTNAFNPNVKPMALATKKKFKFLFVGGTIWRKGPDLLLKAYLNTFTANDDVCLVIKDFGTKSVYSAQSCGKQIQEIKKNPNAAEILYIDEEISTDSLPGIYTACNCLAIPYRGEGFCLPALESLACGVPIIVTSGGATDDFVHDEFSFRIASKKVVDGTTVGAMPLAGNCWYLEPDVESLSKLMRYAYENPDELIKKGKLASSFVKENYSWKNSAEIAYQRILQLQCIHLNNTP